MARIDSLAALEAVIRGKPELEIIFGLLNVASYSEFVTYINRAVDLVLRKMAQNPELLSSKGEDELTIYVVHMLQIMSIDAGHDTKTGGHVDIRVKGPNDYVWLAEAKKFSGSYSWLLKGFQQLNTRYSTGLPGHDSGGILIYSDQPRIDRLMTRWQEKLTDFDPGIQIEGCPLDEMAFVSSHPHERTGRPYKVRHIPLSLYFEPKDK